MKRNTPHYIPLLDETKKETQGRQVKIKFKNSTDANYYSKADYIAAMNYIELSRQIGIFHVNNIQNGLFPSFVVNMNNGVPETDEEMDIEKRNIERNVSGAVNSGKFLIFFNENKERAAEFIPFPTNDADKLYDMLEQTCTRQIMIAHRVTSPLLFGIRDSSGLGSNKDEMETALKIFNEQVIEPSQRMICECAEEILQLANVSADVFIVMNNEEVNATDSKVVTAAPATSQPVIDGAKISSALDVVAKVKEGILTDQQAIIFLIQFLQLPEEVAKSFFISDGQMAVQKLSAHLKKKVELESSEDCCQTAPTFTKEQEDFWKNKLSGIGEIIDEDEWELVYEEEVGTSQEESDIIKKLVNVNMAYGSYANPDEKSNWGDSGLYKLRYKYSENISASTRDFCRDMVGLSKSGVVFRYEDIAPNSETNMSDAGVNGNFAPQGENTYDIFTYKGGSYCHHSWLRRIYFRKREKGKFLPNDGLANDERVKDSNLPFLPPKGKESIRPINTPNRGSLKNID
jgi:hypothetical protein